MRRPIQSMALLSPITRMGTWWRMAGGSLADECCCVEELAALVEHA
jgi:hypothetical protein